MVQSIVEPVETRKYWKRGILVEPKCQIYYRSLLWSTIKYSSGSRKSKDSHIILYIKTTIII